MPHDRTGLKMDIGDIVEVVPINAKVRLGYGTREHIGTVMNLVERDTCNGELAWVDIDGNKQQDFFETYNSIIILKRDGSFCNKNKS